MRNDELRFAIIDCFDFVLFESYDVLECWNVYKDLADVYDLEGVYDYQRFMYLDEADASIL